MSTVYRTIPTNYLAAAALLGDRTSRPIGYETNIHRRFGAAGDAIGMMHHATAIVVWREDGSILVDCEGYRTSTTKRRVNAAIAETGWNVYARNFEWRLVNRHTGEDRPYVDGVLLTGTECRELVH